MSVSVRRGLTVLLFLLSILLWVLVKYLWIGPVVNEDSYDFPAITPSPSPQITATPLATNSSESTSSSDIATTSSKIQFRLNY